MPARDKSQSDTSKLRRWRPVTACFESILAVSVGLTVWAGNLDAATTARQLEIRPKTIDERIAALRERLDAKEGASRLDENAVLHLAQWYNWNNWPNLWNNYWPNWSNYWYN